MLPTLVRAVFDVLVFSVPTQNYLSESLKTMDKSFPSQGAGSLAENKPKDLAGADLKK